MLHVCLGSSLTRKKLKKVVVGMREHHYAKPHREFTDIDVAFSGKLWAKMLPSEKAYYVRFYHNYHGSRNHKDGFDTAYNDDRLRKEVAKEATRRRRDTMGAVASGLAQYHLDAEGDTASETYINTSNSSGNAFLVGTEPYRGAGYATDSWQLEEDAMIAELDRKLGNDDGN